MFERFTAAARAVVLSAQEHALEATHTEITAADVLAAVLDESGVAARVLRELGLSDHRRLTELAESATASDREALGSIGIDLEAIRRRAEQAFGPGALDRPRRQRAGLFGRRGGSHLRFSAEAKQALELALRESTDEGHGYLGSEHLFLGLLGTRQGSSLALLRQLGINEDRTDLKRLVLAELRRAA